MPTELREHQLELLDANDETRSLLFGTEDTGYLTLSPPAWKSGDARDDDLERPHEDGRYFGRDLRGAGSVGLEIGVLTDRLAVGAATAYERDSDYTDALQTWWDDEDFRTNPRDLAILRTCVAGRTWRAYGRPRRFDAVKSRLAQLGYTPVVCDFALIDNRVYADDPETLTVPLVAAPSGGFTAPFTAPIVLTPETSNGDVITIGGVKKTWTWVAFRGPVLNPQVTIGPLTIGLTASIPDGLTVTVDPRPWSRGVTREDGANYAGSLSVATPILQEILIRPGTYNVAYSGIDATGTSSCTVSWRTARSLP
jgi:hypothetical protein